MTQAGPLIFEIRRGALADGPGLRTTVFFKGCNLRCPWCHNPESQDPDAEIGFFPRDCIRCGECVAACREAACSLDHPGRIDRAGCTRCGDCAAVCPSKSLRLIGRAYAVDELLESILRDRTFYEVSGGGVTLSGGEPTLHPDYCEEVLGRLKEIPLNTALQTNGFFPWEEFRRKILPRVDLIMFDLKIADPVRHREVTGRDNSPALANLAHLLRAAPARVLPRIPLIPGFTATPENLAAWAGYLQGLGVKRCAVLPYNPTWGHKAESLGRVPEPRLPRRFLTPAELAACQEAFAWADLVDF